MPKYSFRSMAAVAKRITIIDTEPYLKFKGALENIDEIRIIRKGLIEVRTYNTTFISKPTVTKVFEAAEVILPMGFNFTVTIGVNRKGVPALEVGCAVVTKPMILAAYRDAKALESNVDTLTVYNNRYSRDLTKGQMFDAVRVLQKLYPEFLPKSLRDLKSI